MVVCGFCRADLPDKAALSAHVASRHGPGDRTGQAYRTPDVVDALCAAAKEFQRATQDRINASFTEAAFDPTDWRRAERELLDALARVEE